MKAICSLQKWHGFFENLRSFLFLHSRLGRMATDFADHLNQVAHHRAGGRLSSRSHSVKQDLPAEASVNLHGIVHAIDLGKHMSSRH